MRPPQRQIVAQISAELRIHVVTLYSWMNAWRLQREFVPTSQMYPEGWGLADKFTAVMETVGLNAVSPSSYFQGGFYSWINWIDAVNHFT